MSTELPVTGAALAAPTDEAAPRTDAGRIARSTLLVMMAFGAAKAISLVQTFIIARVFGVGIEWDAFVTANRVPELIFTLIAGGALSHAFIPVFGGQLARGDASVAWRTASHVINTIFTVTLLTSAVVFVLAPWLVANVLAPGFDAAAQAQTATMMRILLLSTLIFSVSGIVMGILHSHNHFLLPALAPILFDVGLLLGILVLLGPFGVYGIAWGAVLGALLHLAIQVPGLIRYRARWSARLGLGDPTLWRVVRLMLPRVAGLGVFSLNIIVMNNIASRLGTGAVSALDWGWRLMQIPETLIGTAMGVVIFPTLASLSEVGDQVGKRRAMTGALRFILVATVPAAIGLVVVGRPLISILEGGAFDASATLLVYSTLRFFALGLIVHSLLEVVARSFYADKDTLTPLWAALVGAGLNLVLSFTLSGVLDVQRAQATHGFAQSVAGLFPALGLPMLSGSVGGLALANSLGVFAEVGVLLWVLRRRWGAVREDALGSTLVKALAAGVVMALAVSLVGVGWDVAGLTGQGRLMAIVQVGVMALVGVAVFTGVALLLRLDDLRTLLGMVLRRGRGSTAGAAPEAATV